MMTLLHPAWLVLAIPLVASVWVWPPITWLLRVLRLLTLALVLLSLAGLTLRLPSRAGTVVIVADRSTSMPPNSDAAHTELIELVHKGMRSHASSADRLAVISFGQEAVIEQSPDTEKFSGFINAYDRDASNLTEALELALALIPLDNPGRILIQSDGRWTGRDPNTAAVRAAGRGIAIDYRVQQRAAANDLAIARLDAPAEVGPGESFLITAWVHAPVAQDASFELRRGQQVIASGKRALTSGFNKLTFRDRAVEPGTQSYTLVITGSGDDPVPENNRARLLVGVQGAKPVLCLSQSPQSGLPRLLRAGGLHVVMKTPEECQWTLEQLSGFTGVVIENVPAEKIGQTGMETLAAWVREAGGGLMFTGGRASFGPGGYYRSPLEPVLPVSMELRNEHRKLSLAIVVALDRSGSMAVPVGGGRAKMDLANLGTAEVLNLLSSADEFGCLAVDTQAHVVVDLERVSDKEPARKNILGIQSMGGGIYVDEALVAAADMINRATAGTKHIILFADAADTEQPGRYQEIVAKCREAGITISVIGLGTEADKDAELLKDIARRGDGRVFFTNSAEELPRLFAQDTFVVARSTFLDEPTPIQTTAGLSALAGRQFTRPPNIGGYNLCYIRPEATLAAVTEDEYKAPVVASWQAGLGRVLCYTGEADGKYTGDIAGWKDVGEFFTSLARWTSGKSSAFGEQLMLTQEVHNGTNTIRLLLDPDRSTDPFQALPQVTTLRAMAGRAPRSEKMTLQWRSADELALQIPLRGEETALTTVTVPGIGSLALPPVCLPYSPEFKPPEGEYGQATLEGLSRATDGKECLVVEQIWDDIPRQARLVSIAPWLLIGAVVLLLIEVLERRTSLLSRVGRGRAVSSRVAPARAAVKTLACVVPRPLADSAASPRSTVPQVIESPPKPSPTPDPVLPAALEGTDMLEALRQARRRSRERTDSSE